MLISKYIILLISILVVVYLVLANQDKRALKIITFLLSFAAMPFHSEGFLIGLNGILIWSYWFASKLKEIHSIQGNSWRELSNKVVLFYYFLLIGVILALMQSENIDPAAQLSQHQQIINSSLFLITVVLFIKILMKYRRDFNFQNQIILVFISSIFFHLIAVVFTMYGINYLPEFLSSGVGTMKDSAQGPLIYRYAGLLNDYELLIDYSIIVIGFSLLLFRKNRRVFPLTSIAAALMVAVISGTRSFIIIILMFILSLILIVGLVRRDIKKIFKIILIGSVAALVFSYIFSSILEDTTIFARLEKAYVIFQSTGNIETAANRNITDAIPVILENTSIIGNGLLFFDTIKGEAMVSHNMLLAAYVRFGIVGIIAILYLFYKSLAILFRIIRKCEDEKIRNEAAIFFSLIVSLFVQELKISALRSLAPMLIYTFLFMNVYFLKLKSEFK